MNLVVLAAGMGSRFGGMKQLTPVGPNGEFLIDYSIYDAIKAGINKVIFVIKKEDLELFKNTIGNRISKYIEVCYAFQSLDNIPFDFNKINNRVKPWGTGQALLSAKDYIDENFIVINADDFYGRESFEILCNYMKNKSDNKCAMVSYKLINTLSNNGSVSRGVCVLDDNNYLKTITERTKIIKKNNNVIYLDDDKEYILNENSPVSVNLFGLTPLIFKYALNYFEEFFDNCDDLEKSEFYLPTIIQKAINDKHITVKVLDTDSKFNGMTYKEDLDQLKVYIRSLIDKKEYPEKLWN